MTCNINYRCAKCFSCDTEPKFQKTEYGKQILLSIECFSCSFLEKFPTIKNEKKRIIKTGSIECTSKLTGNCYVVTKWYDLGNGKIEAIDKIKITW